MSKLINATDYLGENNTTANIGFVAGFVWANKGQDMVEYPLSAGLNGGFGGMVISVGATIVRDMMPENFKWVPSTLLISSLGYGLYSRLRRSIELRNKQKRL